LIATKETLSTKDNNFIYSGCQKNVPITERFFCYNTYAVILFSKNYYDKRYTYGRCRKA
jgi:hypothetical protein